ncbi:hypothetical protein [Luteimonas saliphila]|uniref:hypothetical protein n=1 Tax=Luteimonas saliphila TaxID=2804919 RepID=UPI00192DD252|nr:hypothetical protein [Luteimonas saliphila]
MALSIKTLADAPDQYEGAYVQVSGYYYSYFEHSAIYSHPERELYAQNFRTGIWLFGVDDSFSGKHVEVTGFFTHTIQGHLGQWPGSICATTVAETARAAP